MPSWQGKLLVDYMRLRGRLRHPPADMDYDRRRAALESLANFFKTKLTFESQPVDADGVPAEWIHFPGVSTERVILYLHGGGYSSGSIKSHRSLVAEISKTAHTRALIIDYRLTPEHPFPAAVEDALTVYYWMLNAGIAPEQIVVAGDSAGGGLTLALLVALRDAAVPLPACAICLSPWTDLTCSGASIITNASLDLIIDSTALAPAAEKYLAGADPRTPLASPLFADLNGLPPMLIQVGSNEVLLSDATSLAERAQYAGVDVTLEVWDDMQHVWQFAARYLPEARQAIHKIGKFINRFFTIV